jgi:hypothetical protein
VNPPLSDAHRKAVDGSINAAFGALACILAYCVWTLTAGMTPGDRADFLALALPPSLLHGAILSVLVIRPGNGAVVASMIAGLVIAPVLALGTPLLLLAWAAFGSPVPVLVYLAYLCSQIVAAYQGRKWRSATRPT